MKMLKLSLWYKGIPYRGKLLKGQIFSQRDVSYVDS